MPNPTTDMNINTDNYVIEIESAIFATKSILDNLIITQRCEYVE